MAVSKVSIGWQRFYEESRTPYQFLTRFFSMEADSVYFGDKVSIDIERDDEAIATVVTKFTGPNLNDATEYTNKEFTPPSYDEQIALNSNDLVNRMIGVDPFSSARLDYSVQLTTQLMKSMQKLSKKLSRAVEQQAAQIFQTGKLELPDQQGAIRYELDFQPKSSHFPSALIPWGNAGYNPFLDIENEADVIREDGKNDPNVIIFGKNAYRNFMANQQVKDELNNRRIFTGLINPQLQNSGGKSVGRFSIGDYEYDLWIYAGLYTDPVTKLPVRLIDPDKVIILSSESRLLITSAVVPPAIAPDPRLENLLPGRLSSVEQGFDVTPNIFTSTNNKQLFAELETRTLLVPVAIDGFGCIDTGTP